MSQTTYFLPVFLPVLSCVITLVALKLFSNRRLFLDVPNTRSLHQTPVPRIGGIGIMLGVCIAGLFVPQFFSLVILGILLAIISIFDDRYGLPVVLRLAAHFIAAVALVWWVIPVTNVVMALVTMVAVAWMTNLYNFMDGSDGLAGGMAVFGFGCYGLVAWLENDTPFAMLNFGIASSALAFLLFNFHPAKIFMGDVGSVPLGFFAGALGLLGWRDGLWPLWFPVVVFSPFIVDASVTLLKRLMRGDKFWQAHREHYYQRMVQMGLGHRNTAIIEYLLMLVCCGIAVFCLYQSISWQIAMGVLLLLLYAILMIFIDRYWKQYSLSKTP